MTGAGDPLCLDGNDGMMKIEGQQLAHEIREERRKRLNEYGMISISPPPPHSTIHTHTTLLSCLMKLCPLTSGSERRADGAGVGLGTDKRVHRNYRFTVRI